MPVLSLLTTKDHSLAQGAKVFSCPYIAMRDLVVAVEEHITGCTKRSSTHSTLLHRAHGLQGKPVRKKDFLQIFLNTNVIHTYIYIYICHFSQHSFICTEITSYCNKIAPPNT